MPTDDVRVRPARPDDAHAIARVFDASVSAGWRYVDGIDDLLPMFPPQFWDTFVTDTTDPDLLVVATDADDTVIGYVATQAADGELFVLFVHPDHGGRGVGRRLLELAHDSLRAHGHDSVFLFTHEANTRARSVYEAAGYRLDGQTREAELGGRTFREVRMVAPLT